MDSRVQWLLWLSISRIRSSLELLVCFFTRSRTIRIEVLRSSCYKDYSLTPSFQVVHQHQWVMKSCSWKDKNLWYSISNRTNDHSYGNHSSSFTWGSLSYLFHPKLSNNFRRLYNCRYSGVINVIHSISRRFPRFKFMLIIVVKFHYFCCIECSGPEDLYLRACEA